LVDRIDIVRHSQILRFGFERCTVKPCMARSVGLGFDYPVSKNIGDSRMKRLFTRAW
jgi:hypothetical protein